MSGREWAAPAAIAAWRDPGLCEDCGRPHLGACVAPVTGPPPGLAGADGEPTPLGELVAAAAWTLIARGWWEPPEDGLCPDWLLAGLAAAAATGSCGPLCPARADGSLPPHGVAEHFLSGIERDWHRTWPTWACDCGRRFRVHPVPGGLDLYLPAEDGLPGDSAGEVALGRDGTVRHSDACPACRRGYASTMTDQASPQQVLFAESGATPGRAALHAPSPRPRPASFSARRPVNLSAATQQPLF